VSAFVERLVRNLKDSAPACTDAELARIKKLLDDINPRSASVQADCDALAGYLSGALTQLELSKAFQRRRSLLERHLGSEPTELDRRLGEVIARLGGKSVKRPTVARKPVRPWLDESMLPPLFYADGRPVEHEVTRAILSLQSKSNEPALDPEVRRLVATIDRARTADFALALFNLFLAKNEATKDKFCVALAAALGDERVVIPLKRKILEWPEVRRGKLSEFAVAALASSGSAIAIFTVDAIARRLRTLRRPQAHVARELVMEAANARGTDRETLIDDVLPWHGFTGRTRTVGKGDKAVTVHVGMGFDLRYVTATGKIAKSLSKTLPEDERAPIAELSKNLRDVVKAHSLRLVDRMIAGQAWSADRWRGLFLHHPLLFPFAVRCVFSTREGITFRALEDGTLTNTEDEEVVLEPEWKIQLLHPARTTAEVKSAWALHLADYEIEQPFPQLDRPAASVPEAEAELRVVHTFAGQAWDPFERGRWVRSAGWKQMLAYEGDESACFKTYPGTDQDIDVVLMIDQVRSAILGHYFARYAQDLPFGEDDPRVLALREVPPAIYAEATGELERLIL
jgi:hypothetical protein